MKRIFIVLLLNSTFFLCTAQECMGDCQNGYGAYFFSSGAMFGGHFKYGKFDGMGYYFYSDKSWYIGHWKDNVQHGKGYLTYPDGSFLVADFHFGELHGGVMYFDKYGYCSYSLYSYGRRLSIEHYGKMTAEALKFIRSRDNQFVEAKEFVIMKIADN